MNNYVWVLEYDGHISKEGYSKEEQAINRLEKQGYKQIIGYLFVDDEGRSCRINCIKIV